MIKISKSYIEGVAKEELCNAFRRSGVLSYNKGTDVLSYANATVSSYTALKSIVDIMTYSLNYTPILNNFINNDWCKYYEDEYRLDVSIIPHSTSTWKVLLKVTKL